jgi:hypothetical protein
MYALLSKIHYLDVVASQLENNGKQILPKSYCKSCLLCIVCGANIIPITIICYINFKIKTKKKIILNNIYIPITS